MSAGSAAPKPAVYGFRTDLRDRLPLPVASLYRRAFNAKSQIERHHGAYFLLEAIVKTAASAQAAAYLASGAKDPAVEKHLTRLARPAFGDWVAILRDVSSRAAALDPHPFPEVAPVAALLREKRADLVAVRALVVEMAKRVEGVPSFGGDRASVFDLFERLVAYRNQAIAHAALRPDETFYADLGRRLLDAALEIVERVPLWGNAVLTYVSEVRETKDGRRFADAWDLTGPECILATPPGGEEEPPTLALRSGRLYLKRGAAWLDLHPLLVCDPAPPDACVAYLNRSQEGRIEYLDYVSGRTSAAPDLLEDHRRILGRILGREVSQAALERLAPSDSAAEAPDPATASAQVRRFGDFDILSVLGEGGMGTVYLATQRSLGRPVALKVLPPALSANEVASARFLREVKALARADHPNVVRILASGRTEGTHWYAMEHVEGSDLSDVSRALSSSGAHRARLTASDLAQAVSSASDRRRGETAAAFPGTPPAPAEPAPALGKGRSFYLRLAEVFRDAAWGLQHLHEKGILHRDVKPGNLMLTKGDGRAVVMDLGLARLAGDASMTAGGSVLGTIAYAAPEQIQESLVGRRIDARADVYGLGAALYEMATGKPPYAGAAIAELTAQVLRGALVPPHRVERSVPPDLDAVIRKAMESDVDRRYRTAAAFAEDLDRFARGEPVTASPPGFAHLVRLWVRRNRAVATVAATASVLLVAGLALFLRSLAVERDRARDAETSAKESRVRAEGLAQFMLKDLQGKLRPLGRIDLLAAVAERTQSYYEELLRVDASPATLGRAADAFSSLGGVLRDRGSLPEAAGLQERAVALARRALKGDPADARRADVARVLVSLGDVRREQGDLRAARAAYSDARDTLKPLVEAHPDEATWGLALARSLERLGDATVRADLDLGMSHYEEAHRRRRALAARAPENRDLQLALADSHVTLGAAIEANLKRSLEEYSAARRIVEDLVARYPDDAALADSEAGVLGRTADALMEQGDLGGALAAALAARDVRQRVAQQDPANAARSFALATSQWDLGEILCLRGEGPEALEAFRAAEARFLALYEANRANRDGERALGRSHVGVGNALLVLGDAKGALASYEAAHAIRKRLADADPGTVQGRRDVGFGLFLLGEARAALGDDDGSLKDHLAGLEVRRALAEATPQSTRHPRDLFQSLVAVGDRRLARGESPLALASYREAERRISALAALDARVKAWRFDVGVAHGRLATALLATKDAKAAREEAEDAVSTLRALTQLDPANALWAAAHVDALLRSVDVHGALGDAPGALAASRAAEDAARAFLARVPANGSLRRLLGAALARGGALLADRGEGEPARKAIEEAEGIARTLAEEQPSHGVWRREHQAVRARLDALSKPPSPAR